MMGFDVITSPFVVYVSEQYQTQLVLPWSVQIKFLFIKQMLQVSKKS